MKLLLNPFSYRYHTCSPTFFTHTDLIFISLVAKKATYPLELQASTSFIWLPSLSLPVVHATIESLVKQFGSVTTYALGEAEVLLAGFMNDVFHAPPLQGMSTVTALCFNDKLYMRTHAAAVCPAPRVTEAAYLNTFLASYDHLRPPLIYKPRTGGAGLGVKQILPQTLTDSFFDEWQSQQGIFETFVDYDLMLTTDGMASQEGIHAFFVHEYEEKITDALAHHSGIFTRTARCYHEHPSLLQRLFHYTHAILQRFNLTSPTLFHFEWFINTQHDTIHFCEGGARAGGGKIPELIMTAHQFNLMDAYFLLILQQQHFPVLTSTTLSQPHCCAASFIALRKQGIVSVLPPLAFAWVTSYHYFVQEGEVLQDAQSMNDTTLILTFQADDEGTYNTYRQQLIQMEQLIISKET